MKKRKIIVIILLVPLYLAVFYYSLAKTNYTYTAPGGITKVNDKISIDTDFSLSGNFYTTYVYSSDHISRLTRDFVGLFKMNEVSELTGISTDLSNKELYEYSKMSYEAGLADSLIVAYNLADKKISYTENSVYCYLIDPNYADTDLEMGDLIVKVNGETFNSYEEFLKLVTAKNEVMFTLDDGSKRYANFVLHDGVNSLNIAFLPNRVITETEVDYEILKPNGLGNSGGFMQTLELYSYLASEDLTSGKNIAGTGTINLAGEVGPIGGISEKIIAASKAGVDIFLVPSVHYAEALETLEAIDSTMVLKEISNIKEAIEYLKWLE